MRFGFHAELHEPQPDDAIDRGKAENEQADTRACNLRALGAKRVIEDL
jgi:hypothetical protein